MVRIRRFLARAYHAGKREIMYRNNFRPPQMGQPRSNMNFANRGCGMQRPCPAQGNECCESAPCCVQPRGGCDEQGRSECCEPAPCCEPQCCEPQSCVMERRNECCTPAPCCEPQCCEPQCCAMERRNECCTPEPCCEPQCCESERRNECCTSAPCCEPQCCESERRNECCTSAPCCVRPVPLPAPDCGCRDEELDEGCFPSKHDPVSGMALAMAYVPWQDYRNVCSEEEAWCRGTIFAQLDLDFMARRCN